MSSLKLPFDLILATIDQVAYCNDISTLRSCSLLHRDLLPHCRKHLFRTFDLRTAIPHTDQYLSKFDALLTSSPQLTRYVRVVHIVCVRDSPLGLTEWLLARPFVAHFLRLLCNVEMLGLYIDFMQDVSWNAITPEIQYEIERIITQPCCTQLALSCLVDIPPSLLNKCRFLKGLSIDSCSMESLSDTKSNLLEGEKLVLTNPESESRWIRLTSATFLNSDKILYDIYPCSSNFSLFLNFSSLKHLTLTLYPFTNQLMWKLIHSTFRTLETLILNHPVNVNFLAKVIDTSQGLSSLSRLSRFSFSLVPPNLAGQTHIEHLAELCILLRTCPSDVKDIHITIDLFSYPVRRIQRLLFPRRNRKRNRRRKRNHTPTPFLQELDATLSSRTLFPCLNTVRIEILLAEEYIQTSESEFAVYPNSARREIELPSLDDVEEEVRRMMALTSESFSLNKDGGLWIDVEIGY
ncbi:hypothetical protein CPB84DRAFT_1774143 [Gymnopilus junonius]|uniref:Uncharacterized protein n=1 Tax=Gymnopilus junonius TaxID=109634 RepID=A0A9P5NR09_GYMJU|nr:hypothetical protein CPB84DRAFT_1774143 [Gymnopilus junonius]